MNDGTVFAGFVTAVTGAFVWFLKTTVKEYHARLARHDDFMDSAIKENTAAMTGASERAAQTAAVMERLVTTVDRMKQVSENCEEAVSAQMRRRILAEQTVSTPPRSPGPGGDP